jgi:hypothetical protein
MACNTAAPVTPVLIPPLLTRTQMPTRATQCLVTQHVNQMVIISMPGYIKKNLQEYNHLVACKGQTCPYSLAPKQYCTEAQALLPQDASLKLDKAGIKHIQQIVKSILYYARAVNMTVLMALDMIVAEQMVAARKMMEKCIQLLDYLAHNSDAKVQFHASDMVLNIHSNTSYFWGAKAKSRLCSHFFMGWPLKMVR